MLSDVPEGWSSVALGDVICLEYGRALSASVREVGDVPVYGSNGICGMHSAALVNERGIVVGRKGTAGSVTVTTGPFWPIDTTYFVVPRVEADFDWLTATLEHARLSELNEATGVPGLNRDKAYIQLILVPPLDEQRRIAEVLESINSVLAKVGAEIHCLDNLLKSLRCDLMSDPSSPPEGANRVSLQDVCRPRQHPTISSQQLTASGFPAYGANGQIGFYTSYTHAEPVIAITCRGATCGTVNWIPARSYVTGNAMALDDVRHDTINERFLLHYLSAWGVAKSITGSAQPQITRQSLNGIEIVLPPMEDQINAATALDAILIQIEAARAARSTLDNTRTQVMDDLLSGRVRVPA